MKVKMLQDAPGSPDGVTVNEYSEGDVYEVTDSLGAAFLDNGLAEETGDDVTPDAEPEEEAEGSDTEDDATSSRRGKKDAGPSENK